MATPTPMPQTRLIKTSAAGRRELHTPPIASPWLGVGGGDLRPPAPASYGWVSGRGARLVAKVGFDMFTDKAINAIMLKQEEARRLGHHTVGSEQLLLGVIGEGSGIGAKVLWAAGLSLKAARAEVEKMTGRGPGKVPVKIKFTPAARNALEASEEESHQLGHNYVGSEHLLLGLLREHGATLVVLKNFQADPNNIRSEVIRMISETSEDQPVSAAVRGGSSTTKIPTLEEYGTNLTKLAEGWLDPVVGRQNQIDRVLQILGRRTKNNPCLIGEPGVGKTVIAEVLVQRIAAGNVPETIDGKTVITLYMVLLVAGTKYRSEFEEIEEADG